MLREALRDKNFVEKLIRLTIPIALQSLLVASVAAADAFMLGRLDQNSMAAVSLASQVQFVMTMFLAAVTGTGSILGAQYFGKQDFESLDDIYHMSLRLAAVIDILFFFACLFFPQYLMAFFTNDSTLAGIGIDYLRMASFSYLLVGFSIVIEIMMRVTDHAVAGAWISFSAVISNVILNAVFIFGLFGAPKMGARGAALATTISRVIELALCITLTFMPGFIGPNPKHILRHNALLAHDYIRISIPILGASLLWGIGFTSYTAIMGHMGKDAAAANSIAAVVRDLVCCVCNGIGSAAAIMIGNELGAGELDRARTYGYRLTRLSWLIGFLSMGVVLLLTPLVVHFMKLTPQAHSYLLGMMIIMSIYMIGRCVNTIAINGVLDGGGDTKFDMYSLFVMMWCFAIPVALLGAFVFHWSVLLVYFCTCLDEVGKLPWVMARIRKEKWVRNLTRNFTDQR